MDAISRKIIFRDEILDRVFRDFQRKVKSFIKYFSGTRFVGKF